MAEYIEHEATCKDCVHYDVCIFHHHGDENKRCVHFKNKADVAEVVRCKDCKYNDPNWRLTPDGVGCSYWGIYPDPDIEPNCFCSMGAKMDGKGDMQ